MTRPTASGQASAERARAVADERMDFGILVALAFSAFVSELRASLAELGYADIHRSFGYVARNIDDGQLTLTELADRLGITSPGALKIVQQMEATGYVERASDPDDARAKRIWLTKRGRAALAAARGFHRRFEEGLVARHGERKVRALREVLGTLVSEHEASGDDLALRPM
jgi:DNA-binding MarR family transcriptional regulator